MKKACVTLAIMVVGLIPARARAATCTPTGFVRDGINMTAALINPASVPTVLDATGCNIGVYYDTGTATLTGHDIYGANYFGVVVNGDGGNVSAHINGNAIHNIGESPFNGSQHGVGIYIRAFFASTVSGEVNGNILFGYQKGGIVVNGAGARLSRVGDNKVYGLGHISFIAQNGIQIGYGAVPFPGEVVNNVVVGNSYIGFPGDGSASGGILVVGGPGYGQCPDGSDCPYTTQVLIGYSVAQTNHIGTNLLFNNDVGVYASNLAADGVSPPPTPTSLLIFANAAGDDECYNQSYQAGISDQGNTDFIVANYIFQGGGYGPSCGKGIDVTGSTNPQVFGNNVMPTTTSGLGPTARALRVVPEKP